MQSRASNVVRADATRLPIANAVAGTVVSCMSLHDIDDFRGTIREAARVLRVGAHLCVAVVHPFSSAQVPETMYTYEPVVSESYLTERRYVQHSTRDGLEMTFVSMHRPLGTYLSACFDAGFVLTALSEHGNKPIPWLLTARFEKVR